MTSELEIIINQQNFGTIVESLPKLDKRIKRVESVKALSEDTHILYKIDYQIDSNTNFMFVGLRVFDDEPKEDDGNFPSTFYLEVPIISFEGVAPEDKVDDLIEWWDEHDEYCFSFTRMERISIEGKKVLSLEGEEPDLPTDQIGKIIIETLNALPEITKKMSEINLI